MDSFHIVSHMQTIGLLCITRWHHWRELSVPLIDDKNITGFFQRPQCGVSSAFKGKQCMALSTFIAEPELKYKWGTLLTCLSSACFGIPPYVAPPCIAGIVAEISAPPDFLSFTEMETGSMHYPVQFSALLYTPLQRGQQGRKMEPWTQSTTQCSSRFSSVPRSPHVKGFGNAIPNKKYVDSSASAASVNKEKSEGCQTYLLGTALSTLFWDMALPWRGLVEWCDRS